MKILIRTILIIVAAIGVFMIVRYIALDRQHKQCELTCASGGYDIAEVNKVGYLNYECKCSMSKLDK